jgi:hypothetical protein
MGPLSQMTDLSFSTVKLFEALQHCIPREQQSRRQASENNLDPLGGSDLAADRSRQIARYLGPRANLAAPRMVMHKGAVLEGHCAMKPEERRVKRKPTVVRREEQMEPRAVAQK